MIRFAWTILAVVAILWVLAMVVGMVTAFPFGLLGLAALLAVGILFFKVLAESRGQALDRLTARAEALGANGVVALRFTTSAITQGTTELMAYGTAVRLRKA